MSALSLGLIAAACWGFHDKCVRYLSRDTPISACIFVVITSGLVFHLTLMTATGAFSTIATQALMLSAIAGVFFIIATFGLYLAFERGPVRLVAPLIASYPVLSVGWSVASGATVTMFQWGAVMAIVAGVGLVAALSDPGQEDVPPRGRTALYAIIAAIGFAGTFATGQAAAEMAGEMPTTLATRLTAIALVIGIL